jgi:chromosome segregation and condensation protein ScpB
MFNRRSSRMSERSMFDEDKFTDRLNKISSLIAKRSVALSEWNGTWQLRVKSANPDVKEREYNFPKDVENKIRVLLLDCMKADIQKINDELVALGVQLLPVS